MKEQFIVITLLLCSPMFCRAAGIEIKAKDAAEHVGEMVKATGRVTNISINQKGDAFVTLEGSLVGIVLHNFREEFDDINAFKGHEVEITGVIVSTNGKPSIDVISGNQLKPVSGK